MPRPDCWYPGTIDHGHRPRDVDPLAPPHEPEDAERKQPAVELADDLVVVEQRQHGADGLAVDHCESREFRRDDVPQLGGDVRHFALLQRRKAPRAVERAVVDFEEGPDLRGEARPVEPAHHEVVAVERRHDGGLVAIDQLREERHIHLVGVQVLCLGESARLDQRGVVTEGCRSSGTPAGSRNRRSAGRRCS